MITDLERIINAWVKQEFWTRKEALLILSGFHPDTPLDSLSNPVPGRELYLDGSRQFHMKHIHPENVQFIQNYLKLSFQRSKDQSTPQEWIDWAKSKSFTPFWLDLIENRSVETANSSQFSYSKVDEHGKVLQDNNKKGRRERQIELILEAIRELKYDNLKIPNGGKAEIRRLCIKNNPEMFTESGFDHAWKVGNNRSFRLENYSHYIFAKMPS